MKIITAMRSLLFALIVFLHTGFIPAQAQKVINDPNIQVRQLGAFTNIEVSSSISLFLAQGPQNVAVSASDAQDAGLIVTEVKGNTLKIYTTKNGVNWNNKHLKAYVSLPTITGVSASGASEVKVDGVLNATDLEIGCSGASEFRGNINTSNLRINASGASDVWLGGKAINVRMNVSGSCDVNAYELASDFADVEVSGASDVQLTVNRELKVEASGASDIAYKGTGTVREAKVSGSSDIKKKS